MEGKQTQSIIWRACQGRTNCDSSRARSWWTTSMREVCLEESSTFLNTPSTLDLLFNLDITRMNTGRTIYCCAELSMTCGSDKSILPSNRSCMKSLYAARAKHLVSRAPTPFWLPGHILLKPMEIIPPTLCQRPEKMCPIGRQSQPSTIGRRN